MTRLATPASDQVAPGTQRVLDTLLLALGYPDPAKKYGNPVSRFEPGRLFTFA